MDVKNYCADYTQEELIQIRDGIKEANNLLIKNYATPDNVNSMLQAVNDQDLSIVDDDVAILALSYFINDFNAEIINKELFRREMEE